MEHRHFLKLAFGAAASIAVFTVVAQAAPLPPISLEQSLVPPRAESAVPAVVAQDEVDRLKPEEVRWHHGHGHWHWHHWHHHHWHHHHWRHHHW